MGDTLPPAIPINTIFSVTGVVPFRDQNNFVGDSVCVFLKGVFYI